MLNFYKINAERNYSILIFILFILPFVVICIEFYNYCGSWILYSSFNWLFSELQSFIFSFSKYYNISILNINQAFVFQPFSLYLLIQILFLILPVLISVAFYTLLERKILASVQRRRGPNVVGFWGILQPIADGLKLGLKEYIYPNRSNDIFFTFSPIWAFTLSFSTWVFIPFGFNNFFVNLSYSLLAILVSSGLGVYSIIMAGWSSNSRYALLGGLRSAAQLVSYEISLGLTILPAALWSGSLNLIDIVFAQTSYYSIWFFIPFLPLAVIFFISILAETNRTPFDLPESEAELVAGFNVEYSSIPFALFFLAEYSNILIMSFLITILFFGGWDGLFLNMDLALFNFSFSSLWIIVKVVIVAFIFVLVRAGLPRYRYDQLMSICWQIFLPISFAFFHTILFLLAYSDICY